MVFCVSHPAAVASFHAKIPMHVIFVVALPHSMNGKSLDRSVQYVLFECAVYCETMHGWRRTSVARGFDIRDTSKVCGSLLEKTAAKCIA